MNTRILILALIVGAVGCNKQHTNDAIDSTDVHCSAGSQIRNQRIYGFVFGDVATKVFTDLCPKAKYLLAFEDKRKPDAYQKIWDTAAARKTIIGFSAVGDGRFIDEDGGSSTLLISSLHDIKEDNTLVMAAERRGQQYSRKRVDGSQ